MDLASRYRDLIAQGVQASRKQGGRAAIELFVLASEVAPAEALPHFLIASEHAVAGSIGAAEAAFANAVLLAPTFHEARYQLGLLQFSSERAAAALVTWLPLTQLAPGDPIGHFVRGFAALAGDGFGAALHEFRQGLDCSQGREALATDIRRVVGAIERLNAPPAVGQDERAAHAVPAHVLLSGYARGPH